MTDPQLDAFRESMRESGRRHTHCVYCGREMVDVVEPDQLCDRETGERKPIVWRQCPKWPRNSFFAMFGGVHEKFQRDNPTFSVEYR